MTSRRVDGRPVTGEASIDAGGFGEPTAGIDVALPVALGGVSLGGLDARAAARSVSDWRPVRRPVALPSAGWSTRPQSGWTYVRVTRVHTTFEAGPRGASYAHIQSMWTGSRLEA